MTMKKSKKFSGKDYHVIWICFYDYYRVFDKDGNGFITIDELEMTMLSLGETLTPSELQEMMDEVDSDRDGKVSFRQWSKDRSNHCQGSESQTK